MKGDRYKHSVTEKQSKKLRGAGHSFLTVSFFDDGTVELQASPNGTGNWGAILNNRAMRELRDLLDARLKENADEDP